MAIFLRKSQSNVLRVYTSSTADLLLVSRQISFEQFSPKGTALCQPSPTAWVTGPNALNPKSHRGGPNALRRKRSIHVVMPTPNIGPPAGASMAFLNRHPSRWLGWHRSYFPHGGSISNSETRPAWTSLATTTAVRSGIPASATHSVTRCSK